MAGVDANTMGRARLDFADERDIDEFVDVLGKYERGEISPEDWRRFRLVRGTYGQRQDGVQMLRIKIPQGIVTSSQMRALAGVAARHSRGFCHVTTRQNIQYHFVKLDVVEEVMRTLADEGMTTREACGNSVRNITGCPYAGTSDTRDLRRHAIRRGDDALLPAASARGEAAAQVQDRIRRLQRGSRRTPRSTTSAGARGSSTAVRGFRVTVAGGTSILPVTGLRALRLHARRRDVQRRRGGGARVPPVR